MHVSLDNQLRDYQRWYAHERAIEMWYDTALIDELYKIRSQNCPKCGKKVEYKMIRSNDLNGTSYEIRVFCGCRELKHSIKNVNLYDEDLEFRIKRKVGEMKKEIIGNVDYDKIREEFMERKLKQRTEEEKCYGKRYAFT